MRVVVNNEPMELAAGATLADVVERLGLRDAPCATELNAALIRRAERGAARLADGDRVEVVTLVGGG